MGQPHKHAEAIKAWADGKDVEFRNPSVSLAWGPLESPGQTLKFPAFVEKWEYRVVDPYRHLREALREGKTLEYLCRGKWVPLRGVDGAEPERTFHLPPEQYRVVDPYRHLREAEAAGKTIQFCTAGGWFDFLSGPPRYDFPPERYRVKPEPVETKVRIELSSVARFVPVELNLSVKHVDGQIVDINLESWEP